MTTADPVERVMELLAERSLARDCIYQTISVLEDARLHMIDGTTDGGTLFDAIGEAVRLLDLSLGLPPEQP